MSRAINQYISNIKDNLRLDDGSKQEVISEIKDHLEDKIEEMKDAGLSEDEATSTSLRLMGSAKLIARQLYEAHSQGSWRQATLASMPHLLFAVIFALNWWQNIIGLIIILGLILAMAIYGWWHGKPVWLFSCLGYSLLPVAITGLLLLYLPRGLSFLVIPLYILISLWLIGSITIQTIKRDWLYTALMTLPVPTIATWFLTVGKDDRFVGLNIDYINQYAPWIGISFLALAVTTAAFIRFRQRWVRVTLVLVSGARASVMAYCYTAGKFTFGAFFIVGLITLGLLIGPAIVDHRIRSHERLVEINLYIPEAPSVQSSHRD